MPSFPGNQFLQGKEKFTALDTENMPFFPGNQPLQEKEKSTFGTKLKPFMDTCTFRSTFTFVDTDQKPFTNSCKKHNIDLPFKDTHKKGGTIATISITAMIGITLIVTLKSVNMITTHITMSVESQDNFPTS